MASWAEASSPVAPTPVYTQQTPGCPPWGEVEVVASRVLPSDSSPVQQQNDKEAIEKLTQQMAAGPENGTGDPRPPKGRQLKPAVELLLQLAFLCSWP